MRRCVGSLNIDGDEILQPTYKPVKAVWQGLRGKAGREAGRWRCFSDSGPKERERSSDWASDSLSAEESNV